MKKSTRYISLRYISLIEAMFSLLAAAASVKAAAASANAASPVVLNVCPRECHLYQTGWNRINVEVATPFGPVAGARLSVKAPPQAAISLEVSEITTSCTIKMTITPIDVQPGQTYTASISAGDGSTTWTETRFDIIISYGTPNELGPAPGLRDQTLEYLAAHHPEFGLSRQWTWQGYEPYPGILVVAHYTYERAPWEMRCRWHVMIPPYDWKQVEVLNYATGLYWYAMIDTNGLWHEYAPEAKGSCLPLTPPKREAGRGWMAY